MHAEVFNGVVEVQMDMCTNVLIKKAGEYADDDDRLHNFKVAAEMQGQTPRQALAGMMAKHTVSIYDMCKGGDYPQEMWEEKITDHLNYLFLLAAIVAEEKADEDLDPTRTVYVDTMSASDLIHKAGEDMKNAMSAAAWTGGPLHPDVLPD